MTQTPSPLLIDSLSIQYEPTSAPTPRGASVRLAPGEVTLLLGPSGSGKSSLGLAACGLIPHAVPAQIEGCVLVTGLDTTQRRVADLSTRISIVFQDPDAQIVTGTLLDEVCFGPENLALPVDAVLRRSEQALRAVGLWERRHENPDHLSGGAKQRLAIACALAMCSAVIVLDEPTANLDPAGIVDVYDALAEVVAGDGAHSLLLIEHDLDACIDLVDQIVVLDSAGRPAMTGTVDQILRARSEELIELGIWLPVATRAALRLREAGVRLDPLPITPAELTTAIDLQQELPVLPQPADDVRSPDGTPVVHVSGLTVRKDGRTVLDGIDLEVGTGDLLAVVGVNGAGKTTLLHAIAGVAQPPRGTVRVDSIDPATAAGRNLSRQVGFVFQNPEHQFIRETVADELAHTLRVHHLPADTIDEQVDAMLRRLDLTAERNRHPFLLSGGQKRRLSVGTALIGGAEVLVLDEPTYGQDRDRTEELLRLLHSLREEGTTVIAATHDMQLVADHATHVAILANGKLTAHGSTRSVLAGDALVQAGLLPPPLAVAMQAVSRHPGWRTVTRMNDLPGGDA